MTASERSGAGHLVVTGAAGRVGTMVRPYLARSFREVRLTDLVEPPSLQPGETFTAADILDIDALRQIFRGARAVFHLASKLSRHSWQESRATNVDGLYNVFEAAKLEAVERLVFASSNHAVGFRPVSGPTGSPAPPRPDGYYGVTKALGEAMATLYADKFGLRTLTIRIGKVALKPADRRGLSIWVHPEDLAELVRIGAVHPDLHADIVYGVSASSRSYFDNSRAFELGYEPRHSADDYAQAFGPDPDQGEAGIASSVVGGTYAADGFTGDWDRTRRAVETL